LELAMTTINKVIAKARLGEGVTISRFSFPVID